MEGGYTVAVSNDLIDSMGTSLTASASLARDARTSSLTAPCGGYSTPLLTRFASLTKDAELYDLRQGDCLGVMAALQTGSVNAVITDPPYGMGFQSNRSKSGPRHAKIAADDRVDARWLAEAYRVLTPHGGGLLMFCDWNTSHLWRGHIESAGFTLKSQVIWDRMHHGMGDLRGGFAPMHDVIWYATKGRRTFVNGRPKSVLRHKRPSPSEDNGHPTCKPVELMVELTRAIDDGRGGAVLDPFMGSGSTGVACANLGRRFIGIELDAGYFGTARKRIGDAYIAAGADLL